MRPCLRADKYGENITGGNGAESYGKGYPSPRPSGAEPAVLSDVMTDRKTSKPWQS